MVTDLLLHPSTKQSCISMLNRIPHGLLIGGAAGSGKKRLARELAAEFLGRNPDKLESYAYFKQIDPEGDSIGIDDIRSLQSFLKLSVPSSSKKTVKRVIVIIQAERMRHEAQNALLKTLEEPPLDTVLILTADYERSLLPTVESRLSLIKVLPVSEEQSKDYYIEKGVHATSVTMRYSLSQGQVGLLTALINDEQHPLLDSVTLAKQILSLPPRQRIIQTDVISKNKNTVRALLDALQRITHAALYFSSKKNNQTAVAQWHRRQEAVLKSTSLLPKNPNLKLLLDDLFINI